MTNINGRVKVTRQDDTGFGAGWNVFLDDEYVTTWTFKVDAVAHAKDIRAELRK